MLNPGARGRIVIQVELDTEPITGTLQSDATSGKFSGWMELISAIEHAREQALGCPAELHPEDAAV